MRELRLGLESRVDVSYYQNRLYSWDQMQEIRLGLEAGLLVEDYANLMYTSREMHKKRIRLMGMQRKEQPEERMEYSDFILFVSDDQMDVSLMAVDQGKKIKKKDIQAALREKGIVYGIDDRELDLIEKDGAFEKLHVIARGKEAKKGKDGWYEFFFDPEVKNKPKLLEDGSVDYLNIKFFESVKKGQVILKYHEAAKGAAGRTVTGEPIPGMKGKELPPVTGCGFVLQEDKKTYIAGMDGKIDWLDGRIEITSLLLLNEVTRLTGNVEFDGSVQVMGNVGDGVTIKATRDILINGYIESAVIEAGGDAIFRMGNNAKGTGWIKAEKDVMGKFFENAKVIAGRDIKANYCLNSELQAGRNVHISGKFGVLAGGSIQAVCKVESHNVGNAAGLSTQIQIGKKGGFFTEKQELEKQLETVQKELAMLVRSSLDFKRKYSPEERNTNPIYLKIEDAIYIKKKELEMLQEEEKHLKRKIKANMQSKLVERGVVHPGVRVEINKAAWTADRIRNVSIYNKNGTIVIRRNG